MTQLLSPELLANLDPLWRNNWSLMFTSRKPPLLLDPGREGANLIKAACGKSNRAFAVVTEDGLLDKVRWAGSASGPGRGAAGRFWGWAWDRALQRARLLLELGGQITGLASCLPGTHPRMLP